MAATRPGNARRFAVLAGNRSGLAAVEFAFILPILVVLWLGGVEYTQILNVNRKVETMVSAAGELVAQSRLLTVADIEGIFDIAIAALDPLDPAGASLVLTALAIDETGRATVAWSLGRGTTRSYPEGVALNIALSPAPGSPHRQLIMAEAAYPYRPAVGYMLTGLLTVNERMYVTPEAGTVVRLCDDAYSDCE